MIWVPDKDPVDKANCRCTCWDTVFKGSYQNQNDIGYKHFYFNATLQTYVIWIITVCHMIALYEAVKYLWLTFTSGDIRTSMVFLFLLDIYPIYYSWWNYTNYFNDDFYQQFTHQFFFSATEFVSICFILQLCSKKYEIDKWKIMTVICISFVHLLIGGVDQFFVQMFLGEGRNYQKMRNFGFMVPDLLHITIPMQVYRRSWNSIQSVNKQQQLFTKKDVGYAVSAICGGFIIGKLILR
ncbi:uncharacterized protein LOC110450366 isoform X2 [Mizuhopecten yessoensis]|nr:uncharacterized protein LOC110450366 isoform X2 [Mizuhopecten yessoensis]